MSALDSKKNNNDNKNSKTKNLDNNSKISSIKSRDSLCCNNEFGSIFREFFCGPNERLKTKKKNNDIEFDNISLNRFIIFLFEILEMKLKSFKTKMIKKFV